MKVTAQMIDAAMKKATEAGLLPRHAHHEDLLNNQELIRAVLQAALEAAPAAMLVPNHAAASTVDLGAVCRKRSFTPLSMGQLLVSFPL